MTSLADLARQCAAFPAQLDAARAAAARKGAAELTAVVRRNTRAIAADSRLSGVGKRGARINGRYVILPSGDVLVTAVGPYQLIERDTKAHVIPKQLAATGTATGKRQRRAGFKRRRRLNVPGVGIVSSVHHPGTRGQHPFQRAVEEYVPKLPKVVQGEIRDVIARSFR